DDTLTLALVEELAAEGIAVLDQTELLQPLMPSPGVMTKRQPTEQELADMRFGLDMAKKIGGLDIGQTVVVKNRAIMAVEAIEGTDACIRRGGQLGRGGVTVAKSAKPRQDMRFDVPGIGPDTIDSMAEAGAVALVIEAGRTLVVDREAVVERANQHGMTIVAMAGDEAGPHD
ncbi:MAG TPA: UDP-2,3-diacylglucosamine diphosphatase LpxI, partial [Negativicutes bacterium]|nr:UDP-2,3-diacylglucosamine diphosphatase LpxI [Negativicutes bacterium]